MPKMQYGSQEHAIMLSAACLQHRSPDSSRVLVESLQQDNLKSKQMPQNPWPNCLSTTLLKPRAFDQKQNVPRTA